jgi:hypothetical protein
VTPQEQSAPHRAAAEAYGLVLAVLDGKGAPPVSPGAVGALVLMVIEQMRANVVGAGGTGEEAEAEIRRTLAGQIEARTVDALEAALGGPDAGQLPPEHAAGAGDAEKALDPESAAALWAFIAASRAGTAKRSRRDHEFARFLAGAWEEATAQLHVAAEGIGIEQARAKVAGYIEAQRAL